MCRALVRDLAVRIDPSLRGRMIILGSAAIIMRGVDLGRYAQDLDVLTAPETFDLLVKTFPRREKMGKMGPYFYCEPVQDVEIFDRLPGADFEALLERATPLADSCGFLVAALPDLIQWKKTQGREKDLNDLVQIEKFLAGKQGEPL